MLGRAVGLNTIFPIFGEEDLDMRLKKTFIAVVLLAALMLSSFGQTVSAGVATMVSNIEPAVRSLSASGFLPPLPTPTGKASDAPEQKAADGLFRAKFEGRTVAGIGEVVDGVYRLTATETDGESWHIKLESNYPTVAGRDYRVTYRFHSDVYGKIKFGDFQEFWVTAGENEVTGIYTATSGTSYFDLQLGKLPAFSLDFTSVEVKEYADEVEYENALVTPVKFEKETKVYERHDQGYAPILTRSQDGVSINYVAAPWDPGIWKSKLFIKTGMVPEAGAAYRITADLSCDEDMPYEVLFNDDEVEKGYGVVYGQKLVAGEPSTFEAVITGKADGDELVLQFSLGEAPEFSTVEIRNVRVEKILDHYSSVLPASFAMDKTVKSENALIPISASNISLWDYSGFNFLTVDSVYEAHDDGYEVILTKSDTSAVMAITQAPADRGVWKAKLYAQTGFTLEAGTTYRIKYKLASVGDQNYEVCFDGDTENAYGALYGRTLTAGGTDMVEYFVTPDASHGPLTLRLQLGDTTGNTVRMSDLSIESLTVTTKNLGVIDYSTVGNVWEEHWDGIAQEVSASGDTATLHITTARSGGGVWSSKLLIATGMTPEPGERYRVSATVAATAATGNFEILFLNAAGDQYGGKWDPSGSGTYSGDFTAPASDCGELVLCFQLGNSAADNTITVSGLGVFKATGTTAADVPLSADFKYPERGPDVTINNYFEVEANSGAEAVLTGGDENEEYIPQSATATVIKPGDDWHIKFYARPNITVEAGNTYKISMDVDIIKDQTDSEGGETGSEGYEAAGEGNETGSEPPLGTVCYKNASTGNEEGFGTEPLKNGTITHEFIANQNGTMEIMMKIGKLPADTEVKVSNVKIEYKSNNVNVLPADFGYPNSFSLEANSGTQASLDGSGNSATATVITPGADWNIKFYALPKVTLESEKSYLVSFQVANANGCQVCFKNTSTFDETGYGQQWLSSDLQTVTQTISGAGAGMEIMLKIGNKPANTAVTISNVQVIKLGSEEFTKFELPKYFYPKTREGDVITNSFDLDLAEGASATFDTDPDGRSAIVRVDNSGDDWHIKFYTKPGVTLESGKTYKISINVSGANGCPVVYKNKNTGDEMGFGSETIDGSNTKVAHTVEAKENGELEILVKMGTVAVNTCVVVSGVKIEEMQYVFSDAPNLMSFPLCAHPPVNFWAHESYNAAVSNTASSATLTVNNAPDSGREGWKVKLFVETGIPLLAGLNYRISADVSASSATNYEICYNNGAAEAAIGNRSGLQATDTAQTVIFEKTKLESDATLTLQFNLGNAASGTSVTVSNIKVEQVYYSDPVTLLNFNFSIPGFVNSASDDGYITSFEHTADGAFFSILQAPLFEREPWKAKVYMRTGFAPETGKAYRVSFDVITTRDQDLCEVFYDGFEEKTYGGLYGLRLTTGKNHVSSIILSGVSSGELTVQFRVGKTNGIEGNDYAITNLTVEEVTLAPGSTDVVKLSTLPVYIERLEKTPERATVIIDKTPAEGREAWKAKLFTDTGVTLKAGQKYRIRMNVKSIIPAPFEVCFNDGKVEKGLGAMFGQMSKPSGAYIDYVCYPKTDIKLVIQLSLGNCSAPNSIILTDLNVEQAGVINLVSDTLYTF